VVDGDTLVLTDGSRVRLTGIDTPESVAPDRPVECYGPEAADQLVDLLPRGTEIVLQDDRERFDRFDRRLAYVYRVDDGLFVNAALVAEGAARAYAVRPNVLHRDLLEDLQEQAQRSNLGLWGVCR
jgi:micrococcal nuclease